MVRIRARRVPSAVAGRSRRRGRAGGPRARASASHRSTTRTVRSVSRCRSSRADRRPRTRTATAARSMRSASASSTACGQPIDRDDLVVFEQRERRPRAGWQCGRLEQLRGVARRGGRIGCGEDARAHPPQGARARDDARAPGGTRRPGWRVRTRTRRAHRPRRPRACGRRRSGGSPTAAARRASLHPNDRITPMARLPVGRRRPERRRRRRRGSPSTVGAADQRVDVAVRCGSGPRRGPAVRSSRPGPSPPRFAYSIVNDTSARRPGRRCDANARVAEHQVVADVAALRRHPSTTCSMTNGAVPAAAASRPRPLRRARRSRRR